MEKNKYYTFQTDDVNLNAHRTYQLADASHVILVQTFRLFHSRNFFIKNATKLANKA